MKSPFPPSASAPGEGRLVVDLLPQGISGLSEITFQYPLKLISPSPAADQKAVLVFLLNYGGGLVGGDQVDLTVEVRRNSRLSIVTQGHTKIFKSPNREIVTRQQLHVAIELGAGVCILPDPVQPFAGSVYEQSQTFRVMDGGSLCLLDWVSAGRTARGEDWDLGAWSGKNEVWLVPDYGGIERLLLRDKVLLEGDMTKPSSGLVREKMQGMGIFGTLVLRGPLTDSLASFFIEEFMILPRIGARDFRSQDMVLEDDNLVLSNSESWRKSRLRHEKENGVLWSAAKVRGCTVVKFAARAVEGGRSWMGSMLQQEGSIIRTFGYESIMCVR